MHSDELSGTWNCISATINGQALSDDVTSSLRLTLSGTQFRTHIRGVVLFDSTHIIDSTKSPKQIDMIGTEGSLEGRPALGIYELDSDRLTLCYVMPGGDRPMQFASEPNSGAYLTIWRKERLANDTA